MATTTAADSLDGYLSRLFDEAKAEGRIRSGRHLGQLADVSPATTNRILGGDWRKEPRWVNVRDIGVQLGADMDRLVELYKDVLFDAHVGSLSPNSPGYLNARAIVCRLARFVPSPILSPAAA